MKRTKEQMAAYQKSRRARLRSGTPFKDRRLVGEGRLARRFDVLKRDNFTCQYCGAKAPDARLEVDHIVPRSKGGPSGIENLITAYWECNRGKRESELSEGFFIARSWHALREA